MRTVFRPVRQILFGVFLAVMATARAQTPLAIYTDHLVNGFQDWSYSTHNLTTNSPVHAGTNSVSVTASVGNAISFHQAVPINTTIYTNLSFWAHGGSSGGQILQVFLTLGNSDQGGVTQPALTANTWSQFTIPLSALHVVNKTNVQRITIKLTGGSTGTFYVDDIQFNPMPAPAVVHLGVNASQTLRAADARWFGVNTAQWDGLLGNAQTLPLLQETGCKVLRWPGGSTSDGYHWASDRPANTTFLKLATNLNAQVYVTANYGSGTTNEAAGWVRFFNITNHCSFKYWEIGNENYGTWENDTHTVKNDPFTYANEAKNFAALMKLADPNIRVGVVAAPGEGSFSNNANHFAVNPRTGTTNYGWTPIMLHTLTTNGFIPDFLIYHDYPQYTPPVASGGWKPHVPDSDPMLLQVAASWAGNAADLRQQITDYLGAPGTNVELVVTENNCDAGAMGQQSTSIVNGLYLADSTCQLMKTEFNSYLWWDLHNGSDTTGAVDATLYGWRTYGDYGLLNQSNARHPTFYAAKLLQYFVRAGDTVLNTSSDDILLSSYAARKADGSLAVLVINKAATNLFNTQLSLTNYLPWTNATVRSFGLAQDEAARTNSVIPGAQDIATNNLAVTGTNISASFPPYSLTLLTIPPSAPQLEMLPPTNGMLNLQVLGQANVRYVLQSSTNISTWISVATNTPAGSVWNITNNVSAPVVFWRAVWLPQ